MGRDTYIKNRLSRYDLRTHDESVGGSAYQVHRVYKQVSCKGCWRFLDCKRPSPSHMRFLCQLYLLQGLRCDPTPR